MKFSYISITQTGEQKKGQREASDKFVLSRDLKNEGETLLSAVETVAHKKGLFQISFGGVPMHEKIMFARNTSSMLEAGLPLSRVFMIIERQSKNKVMKKVVASINEDIKKGGTLSGSMKKHPEVFQPLFIAMVGAGEESGKLAESLGVVASQLESSYALQKKIRGALMYPSVIVLALIGIGTFMLTYIVPTLITTFNDIGSDLPASTKFLIFASGLLTNHALAFFGGLCVLIILCFLFMRTPSGKKGKDFFVLHVPVVSGLVKEINSARTARTLSSLLKAGVSVVEALTITKDVLQNSYYKEVIDKAKRVIETGSPVAVVFTQAEHLYPAFVGEMIAVGEETGDLGGVLMKVATFYETEVDQKTKDMSTIIEPVLMLFVGAAVGFFALSMISPIYSVVNKM